MTTEPTTARPAQYVLSAVAKNRHAKESLTLIGRILTEKLTPSQRVVEFAAMAERWPGFGWEDAVTETEKLIGEQERG